MNELFITVLNAIAPYSWLGAVLVGCLLLFCAVVFRGVFEGFFSGWGKRKSARTAVLDLLQRQGRRVNVHEICQELKTIEDHDIKTALKRLVEDGLVDRSSTGFYELVQKEDTIRE